MQFISYSRKDTAFAQNLNEGLKQAGHDVWIDWEGIPPTADWWEEIADGIRKADSFIFIISPDSVHSEVCKQEIEYAVANNKRFVPVVHRDLIDEADKQALHPTISSHNWIFFREGDDRSVALEKLVTALETDLDHVSEHTRLLVRAIEWDESQRDPSFLLNGSEIVRAETWLSSAAGKKPLPTDLHSQYIFASRAQQSRRQRTLLIGTGVGMALTTILAIFALVQYVLAEDARVQAVNSQATAQVAESIAVAKGNLASSLALAANARALMSEANTNLALALALEAFYKNDPPAPDVQQTLADAIYMPSARFRGEAHTLAVMGAAFSPDGDHAATVGLDGQLVVWDVMSGAVQRVQQVGPAVSVDYSPDNRLILTGMLDGDIILWDAASGEEVSRLTGHEDIVSSALFTLDGAGVVSGSFDRTIRRWDIASGETVLTIESPGIIFRLDFDSTGERVVSGSGDRFFSVRTEGNIPDRSVRVWDIVTGEELHRFHPESGFVRAVAFDPNGDYVLSGVWDQANGGRLHLWNLETEQVETIYYGPTDIITGVGFDPVYNDVFASSWDNSVRFWDRDTAVELLSFQGHADRIQAMALHPSTEYLMTVTGDIGSNLPSPANDVSKDTSVWLWDLIDRATLFVMDEHQDWVWSVDYSPDGRYAASGSGPLEPPIRDSGVRLWDLATGELLHTLTDHTNTVSGVAFNAEGTLLASASWDGTVRLHEITIDADGLHVGESREGLRTGGPRVHSVMFMHDSQRALSALNNGDLLLWDVATGEELLRFEGHTASAFSAVFSPDERYIASGSDDQTVRLWDAATGDLLHIFEGHGGQVNGVTFNPAGTHIVSTSWDSTVRMWDIVERREVRQFVGHSQPVFSAAFSPDGTRLATGSSDQSLRLWEVETGAEVRQLLGHTNWLLSVKFSPDGNTLLSGAEDNEVRLWRADTVEGVIAWGGENRYIPVLTCPERERYNVEPFCDAQEIVPTPTITPTPFPATSTPEATEEATDEPTDEP